MGLPPPFVKGAPAIPPLKLPDNNYGLWIFIAKRHKDLYRRVEEVLRASGRFEVVFESRGKNGEPNQGDAPNQKAVR